MSGVIESIEAVIDVESGQQMLDARAFRYANVPDGHICSGTLPDVRVDFMVFGYRPKDILRSGKKNG